jgi:AraC family transcriptional regulator
MRSFASVEVDAAFRASGPVSVQSVPAGLYACTGFTGPASRIHDAWMELCGQWLPGSGWQSDDRPSLEDYGTELSVDPVTGAFSCRLCFPVRAA